MNVLIVEDTDNKRIEIEAVVGVTVPTATQVVARSLQAALRSLQTRVPDLILLDMSLPAYDISAREDGFQHLSYAGRDVLEYLDQHQLQVPVIVVTAFDRFGHEEDALTVEELDRELRAEHPDIYRGRVSYSPVTDQWRLQLQQLITDVISRAR